GTAESCSSARLSFTHHLPASLRSTPVTALPGYYGGSDFLHPPPLPMQDLPDSHRSGFRPFCLQTPDDLRRSLSHALLSVTDFPLGPFPVCVHRVSRLRHSAAGTPDPPAESSSSRADRSFASRCSPRRLTATQLRSALVNERLNRGDFYSSARACFQAHGSAPEPPSGGSELHARVTPAAVRS